MASRLFHAACLASLAAASYSNPLRERELKKRATTLIPDTCFSSTDALEEYFDYNYPWGDTHNGAALMSSAQVSIIDSAYLQLKSDYTGPQSGDSSLSYNSGTIYAKQHFTVEAGGGLDFQANFVAPVEEGTWPAFWLDGVNSWPPEIDLAEWKGDGKISFNTFNTSSEVEAFDYTYSTPTTAWHTILAELRAEDDGSTVKINFYINGALITTQYGADMVGEPFYMIIDYQMLGSSGSSGPTDTTYFDVQYLSVTSYNP
ncbi:Galactan endo-beta-1,3-galactanase [Cytospora mali]|uniref:Galactan endo-beta-1,3-galactanase n=1 Tax=Cytospora mali TaxID=578113 RepID=A0A194VSL8_CYTMA|nr:Galactan endo-beta-1,3-galactanase [Valsa mali]